MINGNTQLIAHIGYPTHTFKSPMIYNPYFESMNINAVVMPMGCKPKDYPTFLHTIFQITNLAGALITMPHKMTTVGLIDVISPTAEIAGACNAVRHNAEGQLQGDMFDGEGFVRGLRRKGFDLKGKRALVVGCGGVGSAIAASLVAHGIMDISLYDVNPTTSVALKERLKKHYQTVNVTTGSNNPAEHDLVVNATPMGMNNGDPMPMDVALIEPTAFVGEVVMKSEMTAFLSAAQARGCAIQVGSDMLFEQIPAYLEYFGFPTTTSDVLRQVAKLDY